MNQKERALFVLLAIIEGEQPSLDHLNSKIHDMFDLKRPEVLLTEQTDAIYKKIIASFVNEGRIAPVGFISKETK